MYSFKQLRNYAFLDCIHWGNIPASWQVSFFCLKALQEEVPIPGTEMKLGYLSSRTAGYKSILRVTLTHSTIPFNLMKVHLMVAVEGRLFRKWFPAAPNLSYDFIWDKTDVYSQKVYGLSEAFGTGILPIIQLFAFLHTTWCSVLLNLSFFFFL